MSAAARIPYILNRARTIAVVGLSSKPHRPSFNVSAYMQAQGYRIIPVNPNEAEVLGEKCHASLAEAAAHAHIDMVNCFRNSEDMPAIVEDAIAIGAMAVWMQLGITHGDAAARAEAAGLLVVQNHCLKIDHRVLLSSGMLK